MFQKYSKDLLWASEKGHLRCNSEKKLLTMRSLLSWRWSTWSLWIYSQLHDHDHLSACVIGSQTLAQFGVLETVHQLHLLTCLRPGLGGMASVELPCTHLAGLLVGQSEHLAKLPPGI